MANISTVKQLVRLCRDAQVTLFIWGIHGIGKSSVVRQVAEESGIGFIDFRCAQIEASDLRGMPDRGADGRTHFLPPADLPASGEGILLLDELNRASQDVLAAAFQLVLDRRVGEYQLPPGWSIVCAGNFSDGDYQVTELDPALRDRFLHVTLSKGSRTFREWAAWMSENYPESALEIVDFCGINLQHLEPRVREELGFQITPSRRSWEMVARILQACRAGKYPKRIRTEALAGLVGRSLAMAFTKHHLPLRPEQLIEDGLDKWADVVRRFQRHQKTALMRGLASHAKNSLADEKTARVVLDFAELLLESDKDLAIALCAMLVGEVESDEKELPVEQQLALLQNPRLGTAVSEIQREEGSSMHFIEQLAKRPALARRVASAMSA